DYYGSHGKPKGHTDVAVIHRLSLPAWPRRPVCWPQRRTTRDPLRVILAPSRRPPALLHPRTQRSPASRRYSRAELARSRSLDAWTGSLAWCSLRLRVVEVNILDS